MSETRPPAPAPAASRGVILLTPAEFYWVTIGIWLGGIFILTLMPYLLIPRVGGAMAIAGSYFLFFLAWQPIQIVSQRTFGMKGAVIRMIIFVAAAATIASYLRQALPALTSAAP
ncbi:MAG TPA: hypothetical protein VMO26_09935 [Vicinamibacterales bacterium]|nr:hypothetical protein [Vicinamibacterales bacterium]